MAKDDSEKSKTSNGDGKYPGNKSTMKKGLFKHSENREVILIFRENRPYELHANRQVIQFAPYGQQQLSASILDSDGFKSAAHRFTVKEVS